MRMPRPVPRPLDPTDCCSVVCWVTFRRPHGGDWLQIGHGLKAATRGPLRSPRAAEVCTVLYAVGALPFVAGITSAASGRGRAAQALHLGHDARQLLAQEADAGLLEHEHERAV